MKRFAKIIQGWRSLTIFVKHYIWDVWLGSEYASDFTYENGIFVLHHDLNI